jgi:hypothetical protein
MGIVENRAVPDPDREPGCKDGICLCIGLLGAGIIDVLLTCTMASSS